LEVGELLVEVVLLLLGVLRLLVLLLLVLPRLLDGAVRRAWQVRETCTGKRENRIKRMSADNTKELDENYTSYAVPW
jgi:hypothetical protein